MKHIIVYLAATIFIFSTLSLSAGGEGEGAHEKKMVIALKTDEFNLPETDISHLEIGDAETIVTDSGQTIDLLRTEEGVEIYVDGELLEMGMDGDAGIHGDHKVVHKRVEVICDDDEECEETVWMSGDDEMEQHSEHHAEKIIIIKRKAEES